MRPEFDVDERMATIMANGLLSVARAWNSKIKPHNIDPAVVKPRKRKHEAEDVSKARAWLATFGVDVE